MSSGKIKKALCYALTESDRERKGGRGERSFMREREAEGRRWPRDISEGEGLSTNLRADCTS